MTIAMSWTNVPFGKHSNKTLPMIFFADPDWFFWAYEEDLFRNSFLTEEMIAIYERATAIRIPGNGNGLTIVEYLVDRSTHRFAGMQLVSSAMRSTVPDRAQKVIDLSMPRRMHHYDKTGMKIMLRDFKDIFFGDPMFRMTRMRAESFFLDDTNFVLTDDD